LQNAEILFSKNGISEKEAILNKTNLVNPKVKKQTSTLYTAVRFMHILLLPPTLFLGAIGWGIYWVGSKAQPSKKEKDSNHKIQGIKMLMPDEQHEE
jgi:hypothetical protein